MMILLSLSLLASTASAVKLQIILHHPQAMESSGSDAEELQSAADSETESHKSKEYMAETYEGIDPACCECDDGGKSLCLRSRPALMLDRDTGACFMALPEAPQHTLPIGKHSLSCPDC